jgi:hypothetical protein
VNKQQLVKGFATTLALATTLAVATPGQLALAQGQKPPTSTPVPRSKWVTQPVKFGKMKLYEHSTGWFDIKVPDNWTEDDSSVDTEAIVTFTDPTGNAAVIVHAYPNDTELSKAEMGKQLDEFIQKTYKKLTKFKANKPEALKSLNGAGQVFLYSAKLDNGKSVTMYGDAFLEQHDNTLMTLVILLQPEEQYQTIKKQSYEIVNSITAHPEAYTASTEPTNTNTSSSTFSMGALTDYEHSTGVFKLQVPEDWKEVDSSTDGFPLVVWVEPSGLGVMSASATKLSKALKTSELQTNVVSFINGYAKGNKKMSNVKIGEKNAKGNEAAASFTFTNDIDGEEVEMFGVATVKQNSKTVSYLLITLPKASLEDAGDKPTEIFDSFEVDGSVSF